jgi:anti-sigma factor RsiW
MTATHDQMSERDEIEMLLPWYVTGRLDAADTARVAAYLERHPEVRSQVPLVREELGATVAGNEAIRARRLASAEAIVAGAASPMERVLTWISNSVGSARGLFTAPTPGAVRWAAAAAAVVICLQAAVLGTLLTRDGSTYGTASRPGVEAPLRSVAMIAFADNASAPTIARVLDEHRLRIVDGPLPGGFFGVRFVDEPTTAEQQRRLGALATRTDVVKAVLPGR